MKGKSVSFMKDKRQTAKDMTLMLLYLLSWEEKAAGTSHQRAWKGYDFGLLNELEEEGLIYGSLKAKSVAIDVSGITKAKKLLQEYGIAN